MEDLMKLLRGEKVEFYLIEGKVKLVDGAKYPFDKSKIPVQCKIINEKTEINRGFTSGNRSIVFKLRNEWFKAKAIGIPSGISRPIYTNNQIYTYFLNQAYIGFGQLIWGFLTIEEAENEYHWMNEAYKLNLPATKPIGYGIYENIKTITFRNRFELFSFLKSKNINDILDAFQNNMESRKAACFFAIEPSDIRVDEILYALLFPKIEEIIDVKECKEYLRWLGSSCAYNLKQHHNYNIIHGTILREPGLMTNSHLANHIVDFERTWMTDYHMTYQPDIRVADRIKMEEYYCLWHVMNPLPAAIQMIRARRRRTLFNLPESHMEMEPYPGFQTWEKTMQLYAGVYRPESIYEEFTEALIDGIEYGYNREKIFQVERELKREMLIKLAIIKHELWKLYGLPEGMQRGVEAVRSLMKIKEISNEEISKRIESIKKKFEELL